MTYFLVVSDIQGPGVHQLPLVSPRKLDLFTSKRMGRPFI